jgi:short-subunit dehydrogenase
VTRPPRSAALGIARGGSALVTGASTGIGEGFARALAGRGVDLMLTAAPHEAERLAALADELTDQHGVRCVTAAVDLAAREGPARLRAAAGRHGFEPDLLVNNAGVRSAGAFSTAPPDAWLGIVHVNVEAVVRLSRLFVEPMVERGSGAVVNVASTAAFQPQPYFAVYGASKAFLLSLGQALWAECRDEGVRVVTVCVGPVETRPRSEAGADVTGVSRFFIRRSLTREQVVETALEALAQDRPVVVMRMRGAGLLHGALSLVRSTLPLRRRLRLSARVNRWLYGMGEERRAGSTPAPAQRDATRRGGRLSRRRARRRAAP